MKEIPDTLDFLQLRMNVDELCRLYESENELLVDLPRLKGETRREEDMVEVGEALKAALAAVSSATRRLHVSAGMALGSEPLTLRLSGRFLGIMPELGQIYIQITPQGKGNNDGRQKG